MTTVGAEGCGLRLSQGTLGAYFLGQLYSLNGNVKSEGGNKHLISALIK